MYKHIIVLTCYDAEHPYTDVVEKFFDSEEEAKKVVEKCVADELETLNGDDSGRRFAAHFGYEGYAAAIFEDGAGTPTTVYDIVTVGETAMTKYIISMMCYDAPEPYPDTVEKLFDDINEAKRTLYKCVADELETLNGDNPAKPYSVRRGYKNHEIVIVNNETDTPVTGYNILAVAKTYEKKFPNS